jgi:16S rRNA (guanine527-N7)-methyltransferase
MERLKSGVQRLGIALVPEQLELFERYYRELVDWNRRMNLTSITDYEEVQVRHFLDSLTVLPLLGQSGRVASVRVMDVGTGAGFPGIPLKIAAPHIDLTLLEATARKADFLHHVVKSLSLEGVTVVNDRAENAAHEIQHRERFAVVVARAVAGLPALAELTLPFCEVGGVVVAQKKGEIDAEVKHAVRAIKAMGGSTAEVRRVELEELNDRRCLVIIRKQAATPQRYPRRSGMPEKRPLSGAGG